MKETQSYDVVIIGGGIAGMTAAIYTARGNKSCAVLESNITGGLANSTYTVENFPSYIDVHGMDLMQKVRDQVDNLGVLVEEVCEIVSLNLASTPKRIETEDAVLEAKAVILATGRKPIPLDVPTECDQVHHCVICDGAPYKGKRVLVVGGGNSACDEGLYLQQIGVEHITVVEAMDRLFAAQCAQEALLSCDNVTCQLRTFVKDLIVEEGNLKAVVLEHKDTGATSTLEVDGVFVFLGQLPNNELFKDAITLDKNGYVIMDEHMGTNVPGVFSAGDVNSKHIRQLTTAAADGTIAALSASKYISSLES